MRVQGFYEDFCEIWILRKLNSLKFHTKSEFDEKITFCILTSYEAYRKNWFFLKKEFLFLLLVEKLSDRRGTNC